MPNLIQLPGYKGGEFYINRDMVECIHPHQRDDVELPNACVVRMTGSEGGYLVGLSCADVVARFTNH